MTRVFGLRPLLLPAVAACLGAGMAAIVGACTDQTTPPPQCLASFTTTAPSTSAGSVVTLDLALENPDAVSTSSVYVDWIPPGAPAARQEPRRRPFGPPDPPAST